MEKSNIQRFFVKDMASAWANTDGDFYGKGEEGFYKNQIDFARLRGSEKLETDFIGKIENLENDLRFICEKIDLDFGRKKYGKKAKENECFLQKEKRKQTLLENIITRKQKILLPKNLQKISIILGTNLKVQMTD